MDSKEADAHLIAWWETNHHDWETLTTIMEISEQMRKLGVSGPMFEMVIAINQLVMNESTAALAFTISPKIFFEMLIVRMKKDQQVDISKININDLLKGKDV